MGNIIVYVAREFGLGVVNLLLLGFVSWKLLTNHFAHLVKSVDEIKADIRTMSDKIDGHGERIAKLEGRTENK